MGMSDSLNNNLGNISRYNESLTNKILAKTEFSKSFELAQNPNGEYNLMIDGNVVHSVDGAELEAKNIFSALPHDSRNSVHVIFGLGLGYLIDVFSQNSIGSVIVFEPDIEALRLVFEAVDLSDSLKKENVYVVSDIQEFESVFDEVFRYKSQVSLSFLDYHKNNFSENLSVFQSEMVRLFEIFSFNFKFQVNEIHKFLYSTIRLLDKKYSKPLLADNKNKFKNVSAIIVSAGPSLHKNIETIKKYKDNAMIFSVGTALKTLQKNGIVPDFLNVIEKVNTSVHFDLPCTKDMVLVSEPFTHEVVFDYEFKKHLLSVSLETDSNRWFLEKAEKEFVDFETKGTVSYQALSTAAYLGCNPIILVGQDLAYTDGQCYAKGSEFDGLVCVKDESTGNYKIAPKNFEEFRDVYYSTVKASDEIKTNLLNIKLEKLNKSLILVDSQDGGKLPTESGYALFIEYFKDFAKKYGNDFKLINSSVGGAVIDGFDTLPLEQACSQLGEVKLDKTKLIDALAQEASFDKNIVVKNITKDIKAMEDVRVLFEKGVKLVRNTNYSIQRSGMLDSSVFQGLKKSADVYVEITNSHTNENRLLKTLMLKENSELSFCMRENTGDLTEDSVQMFYKLLFDYFNMGLKKIAYVDRVLKAAVLKLQA